MNTKPKEIKLENWTKKELNKEGIVCWKLRTPGNAGAPDRIIVGNGILEFIEFKRTEKHKLSELQAATIAWLRLKGFKVHVIHNKEQATEVITHVKRLSKVSHKKPTKKT